MELICTHCRYQGWLGVILVPKSTNGIKEVLVKNCEPFHVILRNIHEGCF